MNRAFRLSDARLPARLLLPGVLALLTACAGGLPAARMALPAELSDAAAEPIHGIGGGRKGSFEVGATRGEFERAASRLEIFERLSQDRASVRYRLHADGTQAACRLLGNNATLGIVQLPLKRASFACDVTRADGAGTARLELRARDGALGTREERSGSYAAGPVLLELRSVHALQGTPLPLSAPAGYVLMQQGRAVGAVEMVGGTPRLWRPAPGHALHEPVTHAALALALLWDPANAQ